MSIVKRGAYGFGGYGYGQSKPVMNYHTASPDSVTTVVTEISRLTVNDKPPYTGASLQEVCEEKAGAYSAHHGGAAVQKHGYSEQKTSSYQYGSGVGGYGAAVHHDSAGAGQMHGYGEQKASYQHGADAGGYGHGGVHHDSTGAAQMHGYGEQNAYKHGNGVGAYGAALHHDSTGAVQKHGYGEQKASYQHGVDAGGYGHGAVHHDSTGAVQKHGYGEHQAYQYGGDLKGYTALHHESTVEKHGYGGQKAYQHGSDVVGGYGHDSAVQKHGYGAQKAYQQHGSGAGGYGAVHHDSAVQKHGYGGDQKAYQHGGDAGVYGAVHHDSTAVQKHGAYGGHGAYQHAGDGYGEHNAYREGCDDGVAGFDALVQNRGAQKHRYGGGHKTTYGDVGSFDALVEKNAMQKQKHGHQGVAGFGAAVLNKAVQKIQAYGGGYAPGHGAVQHHKPAYGKITGVGGHGGALPYSEESDCSSDEESDCEEELTYVGAGGNKLGTTHQHSAYERRQQHGGVSHYEKYQSTTTQGYSGGGYGW